MSQTVLEMAKDLVMMQVQTSKLPLEDMYKILQKTYANLMELKVQEDAREGVGKEENGTRGHHQPGKTASKNRLLSV